MRSMEELFGGDFPVTIHVARFNLNEIPVIKKSLATEKDKINLEIMSEPDKEEELPIGEHKLTKVKKEPMESTDLAIINVTPKKFSLRGLRK